jgi:transposase
MSIDRFDHKVDRKVETKPARLQRIEVITGVERRRAWSREEKRAILTESFEDGVVISEVARRYGLRPQQLFTWRNEVRKRGLARFQSNYATIEPPAFAPVMIAQSGQEAEAGIEAPVSVAPVSATTASPVVRPEQAPSGAALIEIILDTATIRLHGAVNGKALAVVLRAVKAAAS